MQDALDIKTYQPIEARNRFGLACYVDHALPVTWHLLKHATDFESTIRNNIRCGCGRAMALGALAGLAFAARETMVSRMIGGRIPVHY